MALVSIQRLRLSEASMKEDWMRRFNEYRAKFETWFDSLAEREKQIVTFGGIGVALLIIYALIYSPLVSHAAYLRDKIQTEQKTLIWIQAADKQIQAIEGQGKNKGKSVSPVLMLSILQKHITQAELDRNLTQMKQASNDSIQLQFQKVVFDKLITMLTAVMKENSVTISQMSVTAGSTPGIVNADIMIVLN
jgi:general secretion pathway protein M